MRSILLCTLMIIAAGVAMLRAQDSASVPAADGFQCPVGLNGSGEGYYIARSFRSNGHLGDDWNGVKGGDTDYGDPVYATGHGVVVFAKNYHVGWGNVVIIRHAYYEGFALRYVDSLYGHLADFTVREGQIVRRGQQIGRIGSNNGMYDAHLHFEIRKNINIGMYRSSFPRDSTNYYIPNQFIAAHFTCSGGNKTVSVPINTFPATAPPSYAAAKVYTPMYSPGTAPASHRPPSGVGGLRTFRTSEPPPTPKVVTAPPPTPKPAPPAPVVETPTTASTSKKDPLAPIASKGSPIASSDKKEKDSSDKKDSKKESTPAPSSKTSKTSKTASTKTSDEPPPKESGKKEPDKKEPEKKESATASTRKSSTPAPSSKTATTASTKAGSSSSTKTTAAAKPTPAPSKPSTTASSKSTPSKEPAPTKTAPPEPPPEKTAKADPKPSILDTNRSLIPPPPTGTEGSPIRRSAPGFRVDRFQDLRGMGY